MNIAEELNIYASCAHTGEGDAMDMYPLYELWWITRSDESMSPDKWLLSNGNKAISRLLKSVMVDRNDLCHVANNGEGPEMYAVLPLMLDYANWIDHGLGMALKEIIEKLH